MLNKTSKSGNTARTASPEAARKGRAKAGDSLTVTPNNLPASQRKTKSTVSVDISETSSPTSEPDIQAKEKKSAKKSDKQDKQDRKLEKQEKNKSKRKDKTPEREVSSDSESDKSTNSTSSAKASNPIIASILSGEATDTHAVEKADFANLVAERVVFTKTTIGISSFDLYVAGKKLFTNAQLTMAPGQKYGLIGPNGSGKSTLLKKLLFMREGKSGSNSIQVDTLYVEQEFDAEPTATPLDIVLGSNFKLFKYQQEIKRIEDLFDVLTGDEEEFEALQNKHAELYDYTNAWNEDKERATVIKILSGLGFTESDLIRPFTEFSGGWRMRISLARSLYLEPDLLLLDEPTNHLDFEAIIWLSNYLQTWKGTVIIVSHNIGFINDVCDYILAIESQKLAQYKGNYDSYKHAYTNKMREAEKAWETWDKKFRDLKKKGDKKKLDEHMSVAVPRPPKPFDGLIEFEEPNKLKGNLITMDKVSFAYSPDKPILESVTFGIDSNSRIVLVGPNGSGKSTLVKLMTQEITPTNGEITFNPHARIGYYNQHFEAQLPLDSTPVDYLRSIIPMDFIGAGGPEQSVRSFLGRVRLEPSAHKKLIGELSGGQKARVAIVQLVFMRPNCLILDEPTNHLDIETVEALIDGLREYTGGIVVITHDHNLIDAIDARVVMMDPATKCINTKIDSYDAYCNFVLKN